MSGLSRWAANVNLLHYGLRSQAKMHALVAGRKITARRGDSRELTALARDQAYFGTKSRRGCSYVLQDAASASGSSPTSGCGARMLARHWW